jgi:hypothetical protein
VIDRRVIRERRCWGWTEERARTQPVRPVKRRRIFFPTAYGGVCKSKFKTSNFYFGDRICALCLGDITKKDENIVTKVKFNRPILDRDDVIVPRGTHFIHENCGKGMYETARAI